MAGDPPRELPLVPLVPLVPVGALGGPAAAAPPDAGAAFAAETPRLFALAWLMTGGHDGAAAHALAQARDRFVASWIGATDAASDARMVLVPRACKAARRVHPPATGVDLLDQLFAVQPRARAALVLHEACGLDDAATGQLLEVDLHDAASLQRHALGACRFVGVPELVRATFDEQVARIVAGGVPTAPRPRTRRTSSVLGAVAVLALLGGLVAWRAHRTRSHDAVDPSVTHYVALDAAGWLRDSVDAATVDYGVTPRLYTRAAADGVLTARLVLRPYTDRPAGLSGATAEDVGDHHIEVQGAEPQVNVWITAPCGNGAIASYGTPREQLVATAATMTCESDGSRRVVPPRGLRERSFPSVDRVTATSAGYRNDDGSFLFLRAMPALIEPEVAAVGGAHLVRRDGTRYIVARSDVSGRDPRLTVQWRIDDALVTLDVFGPVDEAAAVELAVHVHAVDEVTYRAEPPTTR